MAKDTGGQARERTRPGEASAAAARAGAVAPAGPAPGAPGGAPSLLTDDDVYLFNEGRHYRLYEKLGAHAMEHAGKAGTYFAVWAPNAERVSVVGGFNGWRPGETPLRARGGSGIWEGFVPGLGEGTVYKYHIASRHDGYQVEKADPFGFMHETPPATASIVRDIGYRWGDAEWVSQRRARNSLKAPMSVYEVHLGSWMRAGPGKDAWLTYADVAPRLVRHLRETGFTHVEFMPVMEHPFYGSWGYQTTGYFAPTSRYGTPQEFMGLVDALHQAGFGVVLDWVPSHFPTDEHGLIYFDGTHLFEHADPKQGFHPDWKSAIFNYGRNEVRSFLLSSAMFWLEKYHADGLRVDAVASMLYLDYSRGAGEWIPNAHGGRENLEAIEFLRQLNSDAYRDHPGIQTVAEESTSWPMVSRPAYVGGLGFGLKWDMGWMHDTLEYFSLDPVHRRHHHNKVTFRGMYAFSENFVLPLSHDEVVHGKGSLLTKMGGADEWQKFANLRALLASQWAQPGKKLLFMGGEIGQWREWNHESSVDWHLVEQRAGEGRHAGVRALVGRLNELHRGVPALHAQDCEPAGFEWVDVNNAEQSVLCWMRRAPQQGRQDDLVLCCFNFTPVPRHNYRVGVPVGGFWGEILNTDAREYGGSGQGNMGGVEASPVTWHMHTHSLTVTLPPLAAVFFRWERGNAEGTEGGG